MLALLLIFVQELLIILHGKGEMLDHNHFSPLGHLYKSILQYFPLTSALLCFPVSVFQGRGNFAQSPISKSVPLHELSAVSG